MKFQTCLIPDSDTSARAADLAVVIDVLRATTVATTAIAAGARCVITCRDIDEAIAMRESADGGISRLLCGERQCRPIDGFDLGNSPGDYGPSNVADRDVVMTTTNGTAAIESVVEVPKVILGAFANVSAVVDQLIKHHELQSEGIVKLVCSGTNGEITLEDVLLAGAIMAMTHRRFSDSERFYDGPVELIDDSSSIALAVWQHSLTHEGVTNAETLASRLAVTQGGKNLIAAGYQTDLVDCAAIDVFDVVPTRVATQPNTFVRSNAHNQS
ncbi:MAG: 2-phosphosulfolactate phosphatase [Planctomycetota bacterium]